MRTMTKNDVEEKTKDDLDESKVELEPDVDPDEDDLEAADIDEADLDEDELDDDDVPLDDGAEPSVEEDFEDEQSEEGTEDTDDDDEETAEALDELEAEELQLLDEEVEDALLVDEAAELRAIRREELTLNVDAQAQRSDEFVCRSCFLVKRISQLANKRKMICFDCAE